MEKSFAPAPKDKKGYVSALGKVLVADYGKKEYYKPKEVKKASEKIDWIDGIDFLCWGISVFSSHLDFDYYHKDTGEVCNYVAMKTEMLSGISDSLTDWTSVPDMDASWLDFGDMFGGVVEGMETLFSEIFN